MKELVGVEQRLVDVLGDQQLTHRLTSELHGQDAALGELVADKHREHGVDILLHGHTHRPAVHPFHVDERPVHRIVLGDWYSQGSVLRWTGAGPELGTLALQSAAA